MSFHIYFDKQVHKKLKKKLSKQKKLKAWILLNQTCTEKQTRAQLWDIQFIFFSLRSVLVEPVQEQVDHFTLELYNVIEQHVFPLSFCFITSHMYANKS